MTFLDCFFSLFCADPFTYMLLLFSFRHFQLQQQIFQENQADSDGAESEEPCPSSYTHCERPARVSQHQQQANAQNDRVGQFPTQVLINGFDEKIMVWIDPKATQ